MQVENARAQAARCRRLANAILDEQTSQALVRLAEEYDQHACEPDPRGSATVAEAPPPGA